MEMKQPKLVRSRLEVAVAAFVAVASIASRLRRSCARLVRETFDAAGRR